MRDTIATIAVATLIALTGCLMVEQQYDAAYITELEARPTCEPCPAITVRYWEAGVLGCPAGAQVFTTTDDFAEGNFGVKCQ